MASRVENTKIVKAIFNSFSHISELVTEFEGQEMGRTEINGNYKDGVIMLHAEQYSNTSGEFLCREVLKNITENSLLNGTPVTAECSPRMVDNHAHYSIYGDCKSNADSPGIASISIRIIDYEKHGRGFRSRMETYIYFQGNRQLRCPINEARIEQALKPSGLLA
jgi:hypothetical protein